VTEIVAEFLGDPHRPHGTAGAQYLVRKLRVTFDGEGVTRKLPAESAFQVLATTVRIAPLGTAVDERITQRDESVGFTKWGSTFVERLCVCHHQRKLVFVQNRWPAY